MQIKKILPGVEEIRGPMKRKDQVLVLGDDSGHQPVSQDPPANPPGNPPNMGSGGQKPRVDDVPNYEYTSRDGFVPAWMQEPNSIIHYFWLRPDCQARIDLPEDITPQEARRLARFLETVVFSEEDE